MQGEEREILKDLSAAVVLVPASSLKSIVMQSATIFTIPILPVVLTLPDTTAFDPWVAC
jgi:hypothetical protein